MQIHTNTRDFGTLGIKRVCNTKWYILMRESHKRTIASVLISLLLGCLSQLVSLSFLYRSHHWYSSQALTPHVPFLICKTKLQLITGKREDTDGAQCRRDSDYSGSSNSPSPPVPCMGGPVQGSNTVTFQFSLELDLVSVKYNLGVSLP